MSKIIQHRGFLRGLTALPLIGGSVSLIGNPTKADVPVSWDLLENYNTWLDMERRHLAWERAARDRAKFDMLMRYVYLDNPAAAFHGRDNDSPSSRAAVILTAAGCPL